MEWTEWNIVHHTRSLSNLWRGDLESWFAAGLFILVGVVGLLRILRSRRRRRERLIAPYEALNRRIVGLLDDIEQVTQRHQMLPFTDPDFKEPMQGATEALYRKIERDIKAARAMWVRVMGIDEKIQMLLESGKPLAGEAKQEYLDQLNKAREIEPATSLLAACRDELSRLEQAHEQAERAERALHQRHRDVQGRVANIRDGGVSTIVYEEALAETAEQLEEGRARLVADPLGAAEIFAGSTAELEAVERRTAEVAVRLERLTALRSRLDETTTLAAEQRANGLLLSESDGNPDPMLAQARQEAAAAGMALDRGEAEEADPFLAMGETWQQRAGDVIRRHREARAYCERAIPERVRRADEIRASLAAGEAELQRLAKLYAPDSWHNVADHVRMARRILEGIDPLLDQAVAAADPSSQRYFFAEDLLVHVEQQQDQAADLLADVTERGRELAAEREAVDGLRRTWDQRLGELDERVRQHRGLLSREVLGLVEQAQSLRAALDPPGQLPHWPQLRRRLEQGLASVKEATQHIDEEVRAQAEFTAEIQRAETWAADLERYLHEQSGDRPRSMDAVRSAQRRLREMRELSRQANRDWLSLVDALHVATGELQRARQWAQEDMNLFRQADQALAQAEREVNQARGYYEEGVSTNVSEAEALLRDARREHRQQHYEAAVDLALRGAEAAHAALERARTQARERKRAITQQRLAQVAGTVAQAAAAYYGARHGSRHHYGRIPPLGNRPTFPSRSWGR